MRPLPATLLPCVLLAFSATALGCVGNVSDPARFADIPLCEDEIDVEALFRDKCGSAMCHGAGDGSGTGLDLVSPGVAGRLLDVPSTGCEGELLIDVQSPTRSHLTAKLLEPPTDCGTRMPSIGTLSAGEVGCIAAWVEDAAKNAPPLDAGVDAGPTDAGPTDAGPTDGGAP